jgi:hypothetical protein
LLFFSGVMAGLAPAMTLIEAWLRHLSGMREA